MPMKGSRSDFVPYRESVSEEVLAAAVHLEVHLHLPVFAVARLWMDTGESPANMVRRHNIDQFINASMCCCNTNE